MSTGGGSGGGPDAGAGGTDGGTSTFSAYNVVDIQAVSGAFIVSGLNGVGQVLGKSTSGSLIYDGASGTVTLIHPPENVTPVALNDRGEVLFQEESRDVDSPWWERAFVQRDFVKTYLPGFGGKITAGLHLGNNGQVVGHATTSLGDRAFLWTPGSDRLLDLGTAGRATFVSNNGIVGWAQTVQGTWAFFWRDGKLSALADPGGPSAAYAQAAGGDIVGQGSPLANNAYDFQPLLWSNGNVRILAKLPGDSYGGAAAVNASGDIVGYSDTTNTNGNAHAVIWRGGSDPVRIDSLAAFPAGVTLWHGVGINDRGQILAYGGRRGEGARYFLLTPR